MLDTYYVNINDDDSYMGAISLVTSPAVEHDFIKFADEKQVCLQLADEEKHMISGVVCLANVPIYRCRPDGYQYNIVFTPEVIEQMTIKYSKMGLINSVNLQHDDSKFVDSVIMMEMFIKNTDKGISPKGFEDVTEGSLFAHLKLKMKNYGKKLKRTIVC